MSDTGWRKKAIHALIYDPAKDGEPDVAAVAALIVQDAGGYFPRIVARALLHLEKALTAPRPRLPVTSRDRRPLAPTGRQHVYRVPGASRRRDRLPRRVAPVRRLPVDAVTGRRVPDRRGDAR
jgi:hypothetical protein